MKTDIEKIKIATRMIFDAVDVKPTFAGIVQHPFTNSVYFICPKSEENPVGLENIYEDRNAYRRWREYWFKKIDEAEEVTDILIMVNDAWALTMLKHWKPHLNVDDFSELFASAWVDSENPNGDPNCTVGELIRWFRGCNKNRLMSEDENTVYQELPEKFDVYRGVSIGRNPKGLSWTANPEKANWFAHRFDTEDKQGYVQKALISKDNALAYFNKRGEDEIVVDSIKIRKSIVRL